MKKYYQIKNDNMSVFQFYFNFLFEDQINRKKTVLNYQVCVKICKEMHHYQKKMSRLTAAYTLSAKYKLQTYSRPLLTKCWTKLKHDYY